MFYRKNLYHWEQWLRVLSGLALILVAALVLPAGLWRSALIIAGIGWGLTGVVGFCPMCWLYGRKITLTKPGE